MRMAYSTEELPMFLALWRRILLSSWLKHLSWVFDADRFWIINPINTA